jgi:hypothetical protein
MVLHRHRRKRDQIDQQLRAALGCKTLGGDARVLKRAERVAALVAARRSTAADIAAIEQRSARVSVFTRPAA